MHNKRDLIRIISLLIRRADGEPMGGDAHHSLIGQAEELLKQLDLDMDLDQLLEHWSVHAPGLWHNDDGPKNWYAVSSEVSGGIVAYFQYEEDAFRWRLDQINRALNG